MMKQIEIEFLPNIDEHFEAYSLYRTKMPKTKTDKVIRFAKLGAAAAIILGLLLAALSYFFVLDTVVVIGIGFMLGGFLLFGVVYLFDLFRFAKAFIKSDVELKKVQKMIFTNDFIKHESEGIESEIEWKFYNKYYEGEKVFILVFADEEGGFSVIPKYPFKEKLQDFRTMLNENIK